MSIKLLELRLVAPALSLLLLASCGSGSEVDNSANVATSQLPKPVLLGSVDLDKPIRASGAAPFWALEIAPGSITFTDFDGPGGKVTDFYPVTPERKGDHVTISTQNPGGDKVTITLTNRACDEKGKPPVTDPLTAELRIGDKRYAGCARQKPAGEIGIQSESANVSAVDNATGR